MYFFFIFRLPWWWTFLPSEKVEVHEWRICKVLLHPNPFSNRISPFQPDPLPRPETIEHLNWLGRQHQACRFRLVEENHDWKIENLFILWFCWIYGTWNDFKMWALLLNRPLFFGSTTLWTSDRSASFLHKRPNCPSGIDYQRRSEFSFPFEFILWNKGFVDEVTDKEWKVSFRSICRNKGDKVPPLDWQV